MPSTKKLLPNKSCWTCKLRRKKCDEGLPSCATCERLEIVCYRSSTRPEFMDGGGKEKLMSAKISAFVKAKNDSLRRSRAFGAKGRLRRDLQETANCDSNEFGGMIVSEAKGFHKSLASELRSSNVSNLLPTHSTPSRLGSQDTKEPVPEPVCCEHLVKLLLDEIDALSMQKHRLSNQRSETDLESNKLQHILEEAVRDLVKRYAELAKACLRVDL